MEKAIAARAPVSRLFRALHVLTFVCAGIWLAAKFLAPPADRSLPLQAKVADFTLTDQNGASVTLADLEGTPWVADFVFTRCEGQCLLMNARTKELQAALPHARVISFTADPERDTPQVLKEYAAKQDAPASWSFLTGPRADIERVAVSMKVSAGAGDPLMHSTRFVLVDSDGRVRGWYDSAEESGVEALRRDYAKLGKR